MSKKLAIEDVPEYSKMQTPDMAVATAIDKLSDKEKALELLANLDNRNEIPRLALLRSLANDMNLEWLKSYVDSELALTVSIKARGRDDLVKVAKSPDISMGEGFTDRVKGFFKR